MSGRTWGLAVWAIAGAAVAAPLQRIEEGPYWTVFDYRRDIEKGSALDFSSVAGTDAPAGKYGWLRTAGEHFEFEGRPGVPVRFFGINLCMSLNYPTHEEAERMVTRFKRLGYNAVRLHHHDRASVHRSPDGLTLNPERMDRLDYLVATALKAGLYVTTDLYVSRPVAWRQIGIDRDGVVGPQGFKALTLVHEPARRNWQTYARHFLHHVNAYTGRRYADEPGLPLLVTLNENWLCVGWKDVKDLPAFEERYQRWRTEKKRRYGEDFLKASLKTHAAELNPWAGNAAASLFFAELEAEAHRDRERFLRSIGCRAFLSAGNHGPQNAPNQWVRSVCFDYVDDHAYESHPVYLNATNRYALPKRCGNRDYFDRDAFNGMRMNVSAFSRAAGRPLTVSEWNCCGPSEHRHAGGLYGGALFASQDWGGVWRFAYAHDIRHLHDGPRSPGTFDVSSDPIMAAQERQIAALFLRRDVKPLERRVNFVVDPAALMPTSAVPRKKGLRYDHMPAHPARKENLMFSARVSCSLTEVPGAENFRISEYAYGTSPVPFRPERTPETEIETDFSNRTFSVAAPRACGVSGGDGTVATAGVLRVEIRGTRATVSAIALDGRPWKRTRRVLLSHLTDAKGRGALFEETAEGLVQKEDGDGVILLRVGRARVSLDAGKGDWRAYALDSGGRRRFEVPVHGTENGLSVLMDVHGEDGKGVMEYELVRGPAPEKECERERNVEK